ncbi:hypothetical protein OHB26_03680 [Nocardia sp. NBC_01503]|uniref:hypothetical protein n=1 Tax=Nocardia sp. NBC_01503 TaxID=2975997 RepID=UPI002E7B6026|nr:hypothetical protein [Nocardia sp. NBC_01503]WTL33357.1 hypothetical protein OHB26_03680 [Nocardia sp. NBC_01503]
MAANRTAILSVRIIGDGSNARRELERTASAIGGLARTVTKMAALTGAAAAAAGAVGSLGLGLAGVGALAAPAIAAVALGMDGIKQAAQGAAPALGRLKEAVSGTFANEMASSFEKLGGLLDQITPQMQGIASAVSSVFGAVVDQLAGPGSAALAQLLSGAQQFVRALGSGLASMTQGLLDFGAAAEPVAGKIGTAFGSVLDQIGSAFSQLAANGTLTALFDGFAQAITGIGQVVGPLIQTLAQLGVVMGPVLGTLATTLGGALTAITPSLQQMAGTIGTALVQVFSALAPVLPVIANAFAQLLSALAPLIPPFAQLAAILIGGLAQVVVALAPAIQQVATALAAALMPVLPVVASLFTQLAPVLAQVAGQIGTALVSAINTLAPVLPDLVGAFVNLVVALAPLLLTFAELVTSLLPPLAELLVSLSPLIIAIVDAAASLVGMLQGPVAGAMSIVTGAITAVINAIRSLVDWIGNIHWPSPPSWLTSLFGGPVAELVGVPAAAGFDVLRFLPAGFDAFAAPGPELTAAAPPLLGWAAAAAGASMAAPQITTVNITVEGAVDPQATALQIQRILSGRNITVGASAAIDLRVA